MNRLQALSAAVLLAAATNASAQAGREIVFVSDLHAGIGKIDGKWHPTEDFRWHDDFAGFLKHLDNDLQAPVDLVVLGDFLELWQSNIEDCEHEDIDEDFGCTEAEAAARVRRVVGAHAKLFADLSEFIRTGENTLTIVPGNHDVALLMPAPRDALLAAFDADVRGRVQIRADGLWRSPDGRVVAEHGQQIGKDPNKFDEWPHKVWFDHGGERYLVQSWGEAFVQKLFNELEVSYPVVDNFSGRLEAIRYLRRASGWRADVKRFAQMIRFGLFQQSWRQFSDILSVEDAAREVTWNVPASQATLTTNQARWNLLLAATPDDELRAALAAEPAPEIDALTDAEVVAACDAARRAEHRLLVPEAVPYCILPGGTTLGAAGEGIAHAINPGLAGAVFKEYFTKLRADTNRAVPAFVAYVYGHTHDEVDGKRPPYEGAPIVFNDGAWQRTTTPEGLDSLLRAHPEWNGDLLNNAEVEDLPACYPFVRLRPFDSEGKPTLELWYWSWYARGDATVATGLPMHMSCDAPGWVPRKREETEPGG